MSSSGARTDVSPAVHALAARIDREQMAGVVFEALAADVYAEHVANPAFRAALERSVGDNVGAIVSLFTGSVGLTDVRPPAQFALTDLLAEMGIPIGDLERSYWVGFSRAWREWFAHAQRAAEAGEGTLAELVGPPTELMFEYLIEVLGLVVSRYDTVTAEIRRTRDDRRRALLDEVISGSLTTPIEEIERTLAYRLDGLHLAATVDAATRREAERIAQALARQCATQGSLLLMHAPSVWLLWLGFSLGADPPPLDRVRAAADRDVGLCLGDPAPGLAGFIQTRQDALETTELRRWFADPVPALVCFRDVRLEALLVRDERRARRFVADELGALAGAEERIERIRLTLLDWLATGSVSQTAARQHVHENTIRTRIAQAEDLLGRAPGLRRAELMAALRLRTVFGAQAVRDSSG